MFDWVPLQNYTAIQYHILGCIVLLMLASAWLYDVRDRENINVFNFGGYVLGVLYILYMGLRPINGYYFGDTGTYYRAYRIYQSGEEVIITKDYVFNYFMKWCSGLISASSFFLLCATIYVTSCYVFSRIYFRSYWFYAFVMFIVSFSFWAYGVNGVRNGLATSLFLLGLVFYTRKLIMWGIFILAYFIHASIIIPIVAYVFCSGYKNPKWYLSIWLLSIPLSLIGGSGWGSFFADLGLAEDRTSGYLEASEMTLSQFSQVGFRWDFLLYSSSAVVAGCYYIFKKKITDPFYIHVFGIYCITNAFWILLITAAFSNRFAYLSWFLMPVVIAYPMFRYKIWDHQYKIFSIILLGYFMFTYLMNVILK